MQFQKWPKVNFWTGKKFKIARNAISQTRKIWFIWFHEFFFLPELFKIFWPAVICMKCYGTFNSEYEFLHNHFKFVHKRGFHNERKKRCERIRAIISLNGPNWKESIFLKVENILAIHIWIFYNLETTITIYFSLPSYLKNEQKFSFPAEISPSKLKQQTQFNMICNDRSLILGTDSKMVHFESM